MTRPPSTRRAGPAKRATASAGPRAVRGTPEETRARLVAAAGAAFEHDGYFGTDTNRIAKAAGYAPGTFYKHFADKAEIFVAVYEAWIAREWDGVAAIVADARTPTGGASPVLSAAPVLPGGSAVLEPSSVPAGAVVPGPSSVPKTAPPLRVSSVSVPLTVLVPSCVVSVFSKSRSIFTS